MRSHLLFIDFETTGVDPYRDRIVEACFMVPGEACHVWRGWMMRVDFSAETKAFARKFVTVVAQGGRV
jgi:oligoribonuclease (3'-5' exoribonuclease)